MSVQRRSVSRDSIGTQTNFTRPATVQTNKAAQDYVSDDVEEPKATCNKTSVGNNFPEDTLNSNTNTYSQTELEKFNCQSDGILCENQNQDVQYYGKEAIEACFSKVNDLNQTYFNLKKKFEGFIEIFNDKIKSATDKKLGELDEEINSNKSLSSYKRKKGIYLEVAPKDYISVLEPKNTDLKQQLKLLEQKLKLSFFHCDVLPLNKICEANKDVEVTLSLTSIREFLTLLKQCKYPKFKVRKCYSESFLSHSTKLSEIINLTISKNNIIEPNFQVTWQKRAYNSKNLSANATPMIKMEKEAASGGDELLSCATMELSVQSSVDIHLSSLETLGNIQSEQTLSRCCVIMKDESFVHENKSYCSTLSITMNVPQSTSYTVQYPTSGMWWCYPKLLEERIRRRNKVHFNCTCPWCVQENHTKFQPLMTCRNYGTDSGPSYRRIF